MTAKDLDLLSMVYDYDGVSTELLLKAFFPKLSARSYAYNCIKRLVQAGFLRRTRLPSATGVGSGQSFYTLAPAGRRDLALFRNLPRSSLLRKEMPVNLLFLAHHLQTCATRLTLTIATSVPHAPASLAEWKTERALNARPFKVSIPDGSEQVLIPDAYFVLTLKTGDQAAFCLETDMGTVSKKRWHEKIILYSHSTHPAVLITVPDQKRQSELLDLVATLAHQHNADPTRFWIADGRELTPQTFLAKPLWAIPTIGLSPLLPETRNIGSQSLANGPKTSNCPKTPITGLSTSQGGGDDT